MDDQGITDVQMNTALDQLRHRDGERKQDLANLLVLMLTATAIGIYLIATTILISKDGVLYIGRAKMCASSPASIVKGPSFGYPLLIVCAHRLATACGADSSVSTWIHSAQSVSLLCRVLSLIPLYFIGKMLIGGRKSLWAALILIVLPYPAQYGSSALREWPHMLFLAVGFLFLLRGATKGRPWMFGLTGVAGGLGHMIRPECAQLVLYGVAWILVSLPRPRGGMTRRALLSALALLLLGFATPAGPFMAIKGKILPDKLRQYVDTYSLWEPGKVRESEAARPDGALAASGSLSKTAKAVGKLGEALSDNLMYYFVPALVVGICARARRWSQVSHVERFFIPAYVFLNVLMMVLLYHRWGYMSRRHVLPLLMPAVLYVSLGLFASASWLGEKCSGSRDLSMWDSRRWFLMMVAIGVGVCTPKLLGRLGADKQGYRDAAEWLRQNLQRDDAVAVPDLRISFYAERAGKRYTTQIPEGVAYVVTIAGEDDGAILFDEIGPKEFSARVERSKKNKRRVLIHRVMRTEPSRG